MSAGLAAPSRLVRRLGTADAVVIGLGSMLGAGVFAVFGPAARAAGNGLLVGLAIAAIVAYSSIVNLYRTTDITGGPGMRRMIGRGPASSPQGSRWHADGWLRVL